MSERKRGTDPEADDLVDAPFIDEQERAESAWLLARERDPHAPAPSLQIAGEYAELEDLLGRLPSAPADESWHDDVLRAASASTPSASVASASAPPSRRRWSRTVMGSAVAGGVLAAAAVGVLMLRPHPAAELEVAVRHVRESRGDSTETLVGDQLTVTARTREAGELRVYRAGGTLVARCPDGPGCRTSAPGAYAIEVTLDTPVQYRVILVVGTGGVRPDGTMDMYLDAARAAGARIVTHPPIDVR